MNAMRGVLTALSPTFTTLAIIALAGHLLPERPTLFAFLAAGLCALNAAFVIRLAQTREQDERRHRGQP